jgi:hypothetical protein
VGVASVVEKPGTGSVDNKGVRTYTRNFLVAMQYLSDAPPAVWGIGFPSIHRYDPHPGDFGALAVSLDCDPEGDQVGIYNVKITYTSKPFDDGNQTTDPTQTDQSTPPPDRPWTIKLGSVHGTRLLGPKDLAGKAVVNSAGQPYDPPPEIPCSNLQISITAYKDLTWGAGAKILQYQDSINNAALAMVINPSNTAVFPAKTVRCTEYSVTNHSENGAYYWQVDLVLEYRIKPWNPVSVLDAGTVYKKSMSLPLQPILDETGQPVHSPVPLNGAGGVLLAGGALAYNDFQGYYEQNFATILT